MSLLGTIVGAVAGPLISGLFGRRKQTTTTEQNYNFPKLVNSARKAGLNPLTALLATGGGAGGSTTTTTLPQMSSGRFIGEAVSAGLETYYKAKAEEKDAELENLRIEEKARIAREEYERIARYRSGHFGYSIPQITNRAVERRAPKLARPHQAPQVQKAADGWEQSEKLPVDNVPLTLEYRTGREGDKPHRMLNPEAFEIGPGEVLVGGIMHGLPRLYRRGQEAVQTWMQNTDKKAAEETRRRTSAPAPWDPTHGFIETYDGRTVGTPPKKTAAKPFDPSLRSPYNYYYYSYY